MGFFIYFEDRPGEFADGLDVGCERQKELRLVPNYISLSNQKKGIPITEMKNITRGQVNVC